MKKKRMQLCLPCALAPTMRLAGRRRGMREISCACCEFAWTEEWPKDRNAIRCGNEAGGFRHGYVTKLYPRGRMILAEGPAPAWCPRRKEEQREAV